jgi:hypothetical protein
MRSKIKFVEPSIRLHIFLRKMFDLRWGLKLHTSMSIHAMVLKRSCPVVFLLGLIAAPAAFGQAKDSPIAFVNQDAITTSFVTAPNMPTDSGVTSPSEPGQWLKVEFHFGTTAALKTKYVDAIQFKVWIEGLDLLAKDAPVPGKGVAVGLTGSVTYVNVAADKDIYGVFYVHPSTLGRYSSDRGADDFNRKFDVHLEAYVGGVLMDAVDKNKETDPKWFQQLRAISDLVYRQDQCPFLISNPDRYPAIKPPAASE